jgi:hypothetical protein
MDWLSELLLLATREIIHNGKQMRRRDLEAKSPKHSKMKCYSIEEQQKIEN